jgi:hypothetical protein
MYLILTIFQPYIFNSKSKNYQMKTQRDRKCKKVGKKSVIPSFLTKLYQILEVKITY